MVTKHVEELEALRLKNLNLEKVMKRERADHSLKVEEAVQQWRVLHGNTDAEQKELAALRRNDKVLEAKKDELQRSIVDL